MRKGTASTSVSSAARCSAMRVSVISVLSTTNWGPPGRNSCSSGRTAPFRLIGDGHQQAVAHLVAVGVVDDLEPAELDEDDGGAGDRLAGGRAAAGRRGHARAAGRSGSPVSRSKRVVRSRSCVGLGRVALRRHGDAHHDEGQHDEAHHDDHHRSLTPSASTVLGDCRSVRPAMARPGVRAASCPRAVVELGHDGRRVPERDRSQRRDVGRAQRAGPGRRPGVAMRRPGRQRQQHRPQRQVLQGGGEGPCHRPERGRRGVLGRPREPLPVAALDRGPTGPTPSSACPRRRRAGGSEAAERALAPVALEVATGPERGRWS